MINNYLCNVVLFFGILWAIGCEIFIRTRKSGKRKKKEKKEKIKTKNNFKNKERIIKKEQKKGKLKTKKKQEDEKLLATEMGFLQ